MNFATRPRAVSQRFAINRTIDINRSSMANRALRKLAIYRKPETGPRSGGRYTCNPWACCPPLHCIMRVMELPIQENISSQVNVHSILG